MTKGVRKPPTLCYVALGLCTIANVVFLVRLWGMAAVATEVSMRNVQLYEQNRRQLVGTEHHVVENRMGRMEERLENIFHEIKKQKQHDAAAGPQRDEQDAIKEEDRVEGNEFYKNGLEKEALDKLHQDWAQIRKGLKQAVPKLHDFEKAALELPDNDEDPPPRPRPIIVGRKTIQHAAPKKHVAKPVAGAPAVPAKPVAGAPAVPAKPVAGAPAVPAKPVAGAPAVPAKPVAGAPAAQAKPVAGAPAVPAKPVAGAPAVPAKPVAGAPAVPAKPVAGAPAAHAKPVAGAPAIPAKPVAGATAVPAKPVAGAPAAHA
uniref:Uncharacterized protein n=1 Tax=Eptatretus burgeri TaxID=7764 RepID=A0A8C4QMS8_EPTBU